MKWNQVQIDQGQGTQVMHKTEDKISPGSAPMVGSDSLSRVISKRKIYIFSGFSSKPLAVVVVFIRVLACDGYTFMCRPPFRLVLTMEDGVFISAGHCQEGCRCIKPQQMLCLKTLCLASLPAKPGHGPFHSPPCYFKKKNNWEANPALSCVSKYIVI